MISSYLLQHIVLWLFISLGGFTFGYDTGLISGILEMDSFNRDFGHSLNNNTHDLSPVVQCLIVSSLSLGTLIGSVLAGFTSQTLGRKVSILISCGIFSCGIGSQTVSQTRLVLILGRLVSGIGLGLLSHIIPLYQSEVVQEKDQSSLIWTYQLTITLGLLIAFIVNFITSSLDGAYAYRLPIALQLCLALLICICILVLPESPRMLVKWNRVADARKALCSLWRYPSPEDSRITSTISYFQNQIAVQDPSWIPTVSPSDLKRVWIAIGVQFFQQLTGINFLFYYGISFFHQCGSNRAYLIQIIAGTLNVLATIPGLFLVSRLSRRKILLSGSLMMLLGQVGLGLLFLIDFSSIAYREPLLIGSVVLFVTGFAYSWGPSAWIVSSEMFPGYLRTKGITFAAVSNWGGNLIVAAVSPFLLEINAPQFIGFIWAGLVFVGMVFVYLCVPETSGLSSDDIDELFESNIPAYRSVQWVPSSILFRTTHEEMSESHPSGVYSKVY